MNKEPNIPTDIGTLHRLLAEYRERETVREKREASLIEALECLAYDSSESTGKPCYVSSFDKGEDVSEVFDECKAFSHELTPVEKEGERAKYGSDWPAGSIIKMYDETLRIRHNWGTSGEVEHLDGEFVSNKYYWEFQGDKAELIALCVVRGGE